MSNYSLYHSSKFLLVFPVLIIIFFLLYTSSYIKNFEKAKANKFLTPAPVVDVKKSIKCNDKTEKFSFEVSGEFIIFNNIIKAAKSFKCNESITLTTPADYRFLDNIPPLVDIWQGPISVALYAPGSDFFDTIDSISYLRNCATNFSLIKELVTFHIFFEINHFPAEREAKILTNFDVDYFNCSEIPPMNYTKDRQMLYKNNNKLLYPINKARNIARKNAETYFVFPSDIELFPTPNFIEKFLDFANKFKHIQDGIKRVFVLPIFEINAEETVPKNKTELQKMFKRKVAFWFHKSICMFCHKVIKGDEWLKANESSNKIGIFATGKRTDKVKFWEPFYVSNNEEPFFDERFTWEGQNNKIVQAYSMCILNYDFAVLDNAFLVHKPGVKKPNQKQNAKYPKQVQSSSKLIKSVRKELVQMFGETLGCK